MFYLRWLTCFAMGVALALLFAFGYKWTLPNQFLADVIACVMMVGLFLPSFIVMVGTNFGKGSDWRDGGRIQPVKRPRIGGLVTGYCVAASLIVGRYLGTIAPRHP